VDVYWTRRLVEGTSDGALIAELLALGRERSLVYRETFVDAIGHGNPAVRAMAIRALGWLRSQAVVGDLISCLDDIDPGVRRWTAASLALAGTAQSGTHLIARLRIEDNDVARSAIIRTLGWLQVKSAISAITDALTCDDSGDVRAQAITSLAKLEAVYTAPLWVRALTDPCASVRCQALRALAGCPELSLQSELAVLMTDTDPEVRLLALRTMTDRRTPGIEKQCMEGLEDENPGVRVTALICLRKLEGVDALSRIMNLCADPNPEVRHHAALSMRLLQALRANSG
jgi:HEAT repeat protein